MGGPALIFDNRTEIVCSMLWCVCVCAYDKSKSLPNIPFAWRFYARLIPELERRSGVACYRNTFTGKLQKIIGARTNLWADRYVSIRIKWSGVPLQSAQTHNRRQANISTFVLI